MRQTFKYAFATAVATAALASAASAQAPGIQRTTLQEQPFPGGPLHTVTMKVVVAKGGEVKPHTHPGAEMAYVVHGKVQVTIAGQVQTLTDGGSFSVPPKTVHSAKNVGPGPSTLISTYVVDKTQPLSTPAG